MAAKKTNRSEDGKTPSPYYVVRTLDAAGRSFTETVAAGRRQMIEQPLERSRKLASKIRKSPRKALTAMVEDGKGAVTEIRSTAAKALGEAVETGKKAAKHPRRTASELLADGKSYLVEAKADTRKKVENYAGSGRTAIRGIRGDLDRILADTKAAGRQAVSKIDIRQPVKDRLDREMERLPRLLNMPSHKEMEALNGSMAEVTARVESLASATAR